MNRENSRRCLGLTLLGIAIMLTASAPAGATVTRGDGAQLIVPSTGAVSLQNPAFAPNGATLMFTRYTDGYDGNTGGVFKVPSNGGLTSPIWPNDAATNVNGLASWNGAANRVTFAVSTGNGDIATAPSTGGARPTLVAQAPANQSYLEPTYSPDGHWIVFEKDVASPLSDDQTIGSLELVRTSGGPVTPLVSGNDNRLPVWSPDGKQILFQRRLPDASGHFTSDYHLFTIAAPPSIGAKPKQITGLPGTASAGDNCDSDASWSPDGKWILASACYGNTPPCPGNPSITESNLFLISAAGTQVVRATYSPSEEDGAPAMSPDGRWIYFESHRSACDDQSPSQIWRIASPVRSDGSTQVVRPTTSAPVQASSPSAQNPCYLGSSARLLFNVFTSGYNNPTNSGSAGLFVTSGGLDSSRTVVLHSGQSAVNEPGSCYNAVTGRIAYASDLPSAFSDTDNVWTSLPGALNSSEHEVTCYRGPLHAQEPSWSPDGRHLTYELANDNAPNATTIWTIPATNDCAHPVPPTRIYPCPKCAVSTDNHQPNWSPNGAEIVFQRQINPPNGPINLWTVKPDGSQPTAITSDANSDTDASWSPDSSSIVYSTDLGAPTGIANLFVVKATPGGAKARLTSQCYYDGAPSWSPDGRWVSFETWADPHAANNEFTTAIWRIAATTRPLAPKC